MTGKLKMCVQVLSGLIVAIAIITATTKPNQAQIGEKFYCGNHNGKPTTFVNGRRGAVPIIHWVDASFPPPWNPQSRCREVSKRFQRFYDNGVLNYIKAGKQNRQSVLCVTRTQPGDCLPGGLLITLKPDTDPQLTLQRLRNIQVGAGSGNTPIPLSSGEPEIFYMNGEAYLDMREFLGENSENLPPTTPNQSQPNNNNDDGPLW